MTFWQWADANPITVLIGLTAALIALFIIAMAVDNIVGNICDAIKSSRTTKPTATAPKGEKGQP